MTVYIVLKSFPDSSTETVIIGGYKSRMRAILAIMREHSTRRENCPEQPSLNLDIVENGFMYDDGEGEQLHYRVLETEIQD